MREIGKEREEKSLYKHPFTIDDEIPLYHSFDSKYQPQFHVCAFIFAYTSEIVTIKTEKHKFATTMNKSFFFKKNLLNASSVYEHIKRIEREEGF